MGHPLSSVWRAEGRGSGSWPGISRLRGVGRVGPGGLGDPGLPSSCSFLTLAVTDQPGVPAPGGAASGLRCTSRPPCSSTRKRGAAVVVIVQISGVRPALGTVGPSSECPQRVQRGPRCCPLWPLTCAGAVGAWCWTRLELNCHLQSLRTSFSCFTRDTRVLSGPQPSVSFASAPSSGHARESPALSVLSAL